MKVDNENLPDYCAADYFSIGLIVCATFIMKTLGYITMPLWWPFYKLGKLASTKEEFQRELRRWGTRKSENE